LVLGVDSSWCSRRARPRRAHPVVGRRDRIRGSRTEWRSADNVVADWGSDSDAAIERVASQLQERLNGAAVTPAPYLARTGACERRQLSDRMTAPASEPAPRPTPNSGPSPSLTRRRSRPPPGPGRAFVLRRNSAVAREETWFARISRRRDDSYLIIPIARLLELGRGAAREQLPRRGGSR
jgi:hypothetical protein